MDLFVRVEKEMVLVLVLLLDIDYVEPEFHVLFPPVSLLLNASEQELSVLSPLSNSSEQECSVHLYSLSPLKLIKTRISCTLLGT